MWPDVGPVHRTGAHIAGRIRPEEGLSRMPIPSGDRDAAAKGFSASPTMSAFSLAAGVRWYYANFNCSRLSAEPAGIPGGGPESGFQ